MEDSKEIVNRHIQKGMKVEKAAQFGVVYPFSRYY